MTDELLLGEVTDEVRAFLESMGRKVPDRPHQYVGPPAPTKYQSRHVVHDPPHYRIALSAQRRNFLREYDTLLIEVGERVAVYIDMQADFETYLTSLPAYVMVARNSQEGSWSPRQTQALMMSLTLTIQRMAELLQAQTGVRGAG